MVLQILYRGLGKLCCSLCHGQLHVRNWVGGPKQASQNKLNPVARRPQHSVKFSVNMCRGYFWYYPSPATASSQFYAGSSLVHVQHAALTSAEMSCFFRPRHPQNHRYGVLRRHRDLCHSVPLSLHDAHFRAVVAWYQCSQNWITLHMTPRQIAKNSYM